MIYGTAVEKNEDRNANEGALKQLHTAARARYSDDHKHRGYCMSTSKFTHFTRAVSVLNMVAKAGGSTGAA